MNLLGGPAFCELGHPQSGNHSYTYDRAGRIASWTHPTITGPETVNIQWDKAGNRTRMGQDTFSYDQRNRLVSATEQVAGIIPVTTTKSYSYAPRGTLSQVTDGTTTQSYTFDALSRLTGYQDALSNVGYTYDGLDRIATRGSAVFGYTGTERDPTTDGTFTYSRSPSGRLMAMGKGTDELIAGLSRHGDLTHLFDTSGSITDTRLYDPFGEVMAETGSTDPNLGFQSDFTDPASAKVWMGARWYGPNEAQFLSRDTVFGQLQTPISLNRYTYAFADPMNYFDPDGHWPKWLTKPLKGLSNGFRRFQRSELGIVWQDSVDTLLGVPANVRSARSDALRTQRIQIQRKQHKVKDPLNTTLGQDIGKVSYGFLVGAARFGSSLGKMATPQGWMDAASSIRSTYKKEGFWTALNQVNPVYSLLWSGQNYVDSLKTGNLEASGAAVAQATGDVVSTVGIAVGTVKAAPPVARTVVSKGRASAGNLRNAGAPKAPIHSRYADGLPVFEGQQPPHFANQLPDPAAMGPHSRLRWDTVNNRVYQAREFDALGHPVRDIDFTGPTFPNGSLRPGHYIPEAHRWEPNDDLIGPKSGWRRVNPGEPL